MIKDDNNRHTEDGAEITENTQPEDESIFNDEI